MASQSLDITLKLSSDRAINGIFSLNKTLTDTLTFDDSEVNAKTVTVPVHPGTPTEIVATTASDTYAYIKNNDVTNFIQVRRILGGPYDTLKLNPGEFIFVCVYAGMGLQLLANGGDCVTEYVTFKKA